MGANLSGTLQDTLNHELTNFRDEKAAEAFYSWAVTPWLRPGADVQYVRPARGDYKSALVPSLRLELRL